MSDYIARDAAFTVIAYNCGEKYKDVLCDIENIPSENVAPVVYGEWMENKNFDDGFWTCSACGFVSEADAAPYLYRYCPHCGAKMQMEG